jgi:Helix-hairpin-helix motif.
LQQKECRTTQDVRNLSITELAELPGIGPTRAEKIHGHADVIESGEPLVLTNKTPIKTRGNQPPVCLDIETDGLSPTIIWQFGVYDPASDTHQAFIEKHNPKNPETVLEAFITWFIANHGNRTVLTWNVRVYPQNDFATLS